uniref:SJCHGC09799 protein n=1 Tax=Schistosoma japonicum TaxID=6182 RepID=Q5BQV0_SCHJA|nr:SJCHGC09799 protein [Schistosoma japonicum]
MCQRPCIPGSAGHPWLSDSKIRFMEVAQRCVTLNEELKNVSHCESAIEYKNKENCTRHTEVSCFYTRVGWLWL